jgi:hypothetical protein
VNREGSARVIATVIVGSKMRTLVLVRTYVVSAEDRLSQKQHKNQSYDNFDKHAL